MTGFLGGDNSELRDFASFLDDKTPPLFVADSLSAVLRTEPPIVYGTQRVAEFVAAWAVRRAADGEVRVSALMLAATRKIVEAYRANTVADFDPKAFYRPFVLALAARCPADEREAFQNGLRDLQHQMPKRWAT